MHIPTQSYHFQSWNVSTNLVMSSWLLGVASMYGVCWDKSHTHTALNGSVASCFSVLRRRRRCSRRRPSCPPSSIDAFEAPPWCTAGARATRGAAVASKVSRTKSCTNRSGAWLLARPSFGLGRKLVTWPHWWPQPLAWLSTTELWGSAFIVTRAWGD